MSKSQMKVSRYEKCEHYESDKKDGRKRTIAIVICPSCKSEKIFRPSLVPEKGWICQQCQHSRSRVSVSCANCNDEITIQKSRFLNSKSGLFFCNRKCKEQQQVTGGLMALSHYGTGTGRSRYRGKAFKEYGVICSKCDVTEEYLLVVHHTDGDRNNNDVKNLVVLCHNHHAESHSKMSKKGKIVLDYKQQKTQ